MYGSRKATVNTVYVLLLYKTETALIGQMLTESHTTFSAYYPRLHRRWSTWQIHTKMSFTYSAAVCKLLILQFFCIGADSWRIWTCQSSSSHFKKGKKKKSFIPSSFASLQLNFSTFLLVNNLLAEPSTDRHGCMNVLGCAWGGQWLMLWVMVE